MMFFQIVNIYVFMRQIKPFALGFSVFVLVSAQAVTLQDAIDSAMKIDPTIRSSKFNQLASEENIAIARSRFFPQISLQGSSSQLTQTTTQDISTGGTLSRSFSGPSVNHQFVVRQALIRPKDFSSLRYAELQTQYMELKYKSDISELKLRVINAWIDLIGTQQISQAYESAIPLMKAAVKQEWIKFEQGESTKDAVMEANAQYENAVATHNQAVETYKVKRDLFEKLTRISALEMLDKKFVFEDVPFFAESEKSAIWGKVRDTSVDLQMAKLQELMQYERFRMTELDHSPTLDLIATVNLAQNDATSTQGYQYKNKQLGVQYTIPLYSGGGMKSATRQALLIYESAVSDSETTINRIENDFNVNWSLLAGNAVRHKALLAALLSSKEQRTAINRGFELGVKTLSEVATGESAVIKRQIEFINLIQDHLKIYLKISRLSNI